MMIIYDDDDDDDDEDEDDEDEDDEEMMMMMMMMMRMMTTTGRLAPSRRAGAGDGEFHETTGCPPDGGCHLRGDFFQLEVQLAHRMRKKHREKDEDFSREMLRFGVVIVVVSIYMYM